MSNSDREHRELYRDPSRAKISGVCAGIADYFGLEVWVVRIIAVSALIFFQFPVFLAYIIAHFVLDPKPGAEKRSGKGFKVAAVKVTGSVSEAVDEVVKATEKATVQQVWRKGRIPGQILKKAEQRFGQLEVRLQNMESYVTSPQFQLRKEFQEL